MLGILDLSVFTFLCLLILIIDYQLQYKEAEGSSFRDGSYTETPGTPPKVVDLC